ncbi:unnamed protein product [Arctogadus glacialis]
MSSDRRRGVYALNVCALLQSERHLVRFQLRPKGCVPTLPGGGPPRCAAADREAPFVRNDDKCITDVPEDYPDALGIGEEGNWEGRVKGEWLRCGLERRPGLHWRPSWAWMGGGTECWCFQDDVSMLRFQDDVSMLIFQDGVSMLIFQDGVRRMVFLC